MFLAAAEPAAAEPAAANTTALNVIVKITSVKNCTALLSKSCLENVYCIE